jgi:hypothetical protein
VQSHCARSAHSVFIAKWLYQNELCSASQIDRRYCALTSDSILEGNESLCFRLEPDDLAQQIHSNMLWSSATFIVLQPAHDVTFENIVHIPSSRFLLQQARSSPGPRPHRLKSSSANSLSLSPCMCPSPSALPQSTLPAPPKPPNPGHGLQPVRVYRQQKTGHSALGQVRRYCPQHPQVEWSGWRSQRRRGQAGGNSHVATLGAS